MRNSIILTSLMSINPLVQAETGGEHLVDLIRILDIVADLIMNDTSRLDEPEP